MPGQKHRNRVKQFAEDLGRHARFAHHRAGEDVGSLQQRDTEVDLAAIVVSRLPRLSKAFSQISRAASTLLAIYEYKIFASANIIPYMSGNVKTSFR
jgi:hypothetical protein